MARRRRQTAEKHLCLDKGYDNPTGREAVETHHDVGHIRKIGEEKPAAQQKKKRPDANLRRWVIERTLAWLSNCRAILVRYDKNSFNDLGLVQLACGLYWFGRLHRLGVIQAE